MHADNPIYDALLERQGLTHAEWVMRLERKLFEASVLKDIEAL